MLDNLVDLYVKSRGECEVPRQWFEWAALSAIAACVGDRVKIDKGDGWVTPNLYVFLIGPSGSGKENALKGIGSIVSRFDIVNFWAGQITGPALMDWLNRKHKDKTPINEKIYLFTEELAHAVGSKEQAELLVRTMTDYYSLKGFPTRQGTRVRGQIVLYEPLANWAAGSTEEWLKLAISKEAIMSGFWARVIGVRGRREVEKRIAEIKKPYLYEEMMAELHRRYHGLTRLLEGERLYLSAEARMTLNAWYENRQFSDDEAVLPTEYKGDTTVHKVAACLKLGEIDIERGLGLDAYIYPEHIERALEMLEPVWEDVPYFMDLASGSKLHQATEKVRRLIEKHGEIQHSDISRRLSGRGVSYKELNQIIEDLAERGHIFKIPTKSKRGSVYQWRKG